MLNSSMLCDVLERHISHIAVFAEMWNTQGKGLKTQVIQLS